MNAIPSGAIARERLGTTADEPNSDKSSDAAWIVLEAANDLGDDATVEAAWFYSRLRWDLDPQSPLL